MDKNKKESAKKDQSWDKFKDFVSNLMQLKPEDIERVKSTKEE